MGLPCTHSLCAHSLALFIAFIGTYMALKGLLAFAVHSKIASTDSCSASDFPQNRSGVQCHGLRANSAGNSSASACLQACCDSTGGGCGIWQYASFGAERCWMGLKPTDCKGQPGPWLGGQRSAPPTPPPPTPLPTPIVPGAKRGVVFKSKQDCVDMSLESIGIDPNIISW